MKIPKFLLLIGALILTSCSELLPPSHSGEDASSLSNSSLITGNGGQAGGPTGGHSSEGATVTRFRSKTGLAPSSTVGIGRSRASKTASLRSKKPDTPLSRPHRFSPKRISITAATGKTNGGNSTSRSASKSPHPTMPSERKAISPRWSGKPMTSASKSSSMS